MRLKIMPTIIGISGKKRSGKDTVAEILAAKLLPKTSIRLGFADALYEEVAVALWPYIKFNKTKLFDQVLFIKKHKDNFRLILQGWGTDYRRKLCNENYWIDIMAKRTLDNPCDFVLCHDVRFLNEAESLKRVGAIVIRINRSQTAPFDFHPSETELDSYAFDYIIPNMLSLKELDNEVSLFIERFKLKGKQ